MRACVVGVRSFQSKEGKELFMADVLYYDVRQQRFKLSNKFITEKFYESISDSGTGFYQMDTDFDGNIQEAELIQEYSDDSDLFAEMFSKVFQCW